MTFLLIVTFVSMALAAVMSLIAWRIGAEERRRSDARVAALAAEIHAPAVKSARVAAFASPRSVARWDEDLPIRSGAELVLAPDLFARSAPEGSSRFAVVALGAAFLVTLMATALSFAGWRPAWPGEATAAAQAGAQRAEGAASQAVPSELPLELVALGHDRDGDRLTVRGVVRNPSKAAEIGPLGAVVFAFDADGGFITSDRASIAASTLEPGAESTFVVPVRDAGGVARYRVSFRSGDRVVPHVDRREPPKVSP